jgi:V8-like Glu-specific endopeptidase
MDKPIDHTTLAKRRSIPADGRPARLQVDLLNVALDEESEPRLIRENGRLRLTVDVGVGGLDVAHPFPDLKRAALNRRRAGEHLEVRELDGHRPRGVETRFTPSQAAPTHRPRGRDGEDRDKGGTIFGADDRYLFQDTSFPWRITGKVRTAGGWGSGTMIGPRHVLTASHVVNWNSDGNGNVGWATFTPGYFDGRGPWGEIAVEEVVFWEQAPGSLTDQETAFDYVVLITGQRIGDVIGYAGYRTYDDDWNGGSFWQYTGYPGELSSGERPAFQGNAVVSSKQDFSLNGNDGYVLGHFNEFTPGQSGGAAWGWWGEEPWPRVVGVGSTIGSTAVQQPSGSTIGDNEYGGGPALSSIISWARANRP